MHGGTPIYDEVVAEVIGHRHRAAPFRHSGGEPCYGCQSCLAEAYDIDNDPDLLEPEGTQEKDDGQDADPADQGG